MPAPADARAALTVLERYLAPHWRHLQGHAGDQPSLMQVDRHWVQRMAWQAREWI